MAKNKLLRRYSYLFRISLSFFLIMGIMTFLISAIVISNSYSVMTHKNTEYYQGVTRSLKNLYASKILTLRNHAVITSLQNLSAENNIRRKLLESNPYYNLMAVKELSKYMVGLSFVDFMGIYFTGTNYVITSQYRFEIDDFLRMYSDGNEENKASLTNMLQSVENSVRIAPVMQGSDGRTTCLYIGFPIESYTADDMIIFYALNCDAFWASQFGSQITNPLYFYIYGENNELLYMSNNADRKLLQSDQYIQFLEGGEDNLELKIDGVWYSVFRETDAGEAFVTAFAQDEVDANIRVFYETTRNALVIIILTFSALVALTIYINYKPILSLLKKIKDRNPDNSEIEAVLYEFDAIKGTIHEQEVMIVDYILTSILCGMPIRESEMTAHSGLLPHDATLFCLTVPELRLDLRAREGIKEFLFASFGIRAYIVEIITKNHIVIICAEADTGEPIAEVARSLRVYFTSLFGKEYTVFAGTEVADIRDIQKSYHNSVASASISRYHTNRDDVSRIEGYPTENIELFLNSVQNGKAEEALKILDIISEFIQTDIKSVLFQRYACYDLLTSYIKHCKAKGLILDNIEIEELLVHTDISDLKEALALSVVRACQKLSEREKDLYIALQKDIIEYINSNFTNAELTRAFVADHFKISVLSLSQIFNDVIGIGVREYVNIKRLELSRRLLLTTEKTILQVAQEVGFMSADYFTKLFKATYNVLPSKFRSSLTEIIKEE